MGWPNCGQNGCETPATFRYTWPGKPESHICVEHAITLKSTAAALGLPIYLYPVVNTELPGVIGAAHVDGD